MSIDVEKLAARVAALEHQCLVAADDKADEKDDAKAEEKKASGEREALASEISALERRLGAVVDEEDEEAEGKDGKKASLDDPNGVEEQITQKRFTEVEDLEHGSELATGDSTLDVAPTEYVARLKSASSRLDAVADYLQSTGRSAMAFRVDKIADAIDARVAKVTL